MYLITVLSPNVPSSSSTSTTALTINKPQMEKLSDIDQVYPLINRVLPKELILK